MPRPDEEPEPDLLGSGGVTHDAAHRRSFSAVAQALELSTDAPDGAMGRATIGRFVVLGRIGEGATSTVHSAYDPQLDRKVAIKTLRTRRGEAQWRRRLSREARALARLRHPAVVSVHDFGTHDGQLYLAMEFVDGATLAAWLEQRRRTWQEVLAVFVAAGQGLWAAHQAGIIHRDFKPDNVLIDEKGQARVVDFGLAGPLEPTELGRETEEGSRARLSVTRTGAIVGTPAFLAPECFIGSSGSAASDQFSFCVALFLAMYGERPFAGETLEELGESVVYGDLRRPKTRSEAAASGTIPAWLDHAVVRGLARDPAERHQDMGALLRVLTRGGSRTRRRLGLAVGVAAATLGAGVWAAQRDDGCPAASDEISDTWNPQRESAAAAGFASSELGFAVQSGERAFAAVDEWVQRWSGTWAQTCELPPDVRSRQRSCLRRALVGVDTLAEIWKSPKATDVQGAVVAAHSLHEPRDCLSELWNGPHAAQGEEELSDQRAKELEALRERLVRGHATAAAGRYEEAIAESRAILAAAEELAYAPLEADALLALGGQLRTNQQLEEAERVLQRGFFLAQSEGHDVAAIIGGVELAQLVVQGRGRLDTGELWLAQAESLLERWPPHPDFAARLTVVRAGMLGRAGRYEESMAAYRQAIEERTELSGAGDWTTGILWQQLGAIQLAAYDQSAGAQSIERAVAILEEALGADHPSTGNAIRAQVAATLGTGQTEEALRLSLDSIARLERALGPDHVDVGAACVNHAVALTEDGQAVEGVEFFRRALEIFEKELGPDHLLVASAAHNLGKALAGVGRWDEALRSHERGFAITARVVEPGDILIAGSHGDIASALYDVGRLREAMAHFEDAVRVAAESDAPLPQRVQFTVGLGASRLEIGELERARQALKDGIALVEASEREDKETLAGHLQVWLAAVSNASGDFAEARDLATRAMQAYADSSAALPLLELGVAQAGLGESSKAAETLARALALLEENPAGPLAIAKAAWALCRVLDSLGEHERAEALAERAITALEEASRDERAKEIATWLAAE